MFTTQGRIYGYGMNCFKLQEATTTSLNVPVLLSPVVTTSIGQRAAVHVIHVWNYYYYFYPTHIN